MHTRPWWANGRAALTAETACVTPSVPLAPGRSGAARRGLEPPRVLDCLQDLAAVTDPHTALLLWSDAARRGNLHGLELSLQDQLTAVEHMMSRCSGAGRVSLAGWAARLRLHLVLARSY